MQSTYRISLLALRVLSSPACWEASAGVMVSVANAAGVTERRTDRISRRNFFTLGWWMIYAKEIGRTGVRFSAGAPEPRG